MSQERSSDEMRPEYDIRGGVRGKYLEAYRASRVSIQPSSIILTTNAGSPTRQGFSRSFGGLVHVGPKIQIGAPADR